MRITKVEFENFRNFREHGEILFSTDGKVTVIYGKNGDGKTTLHQLFQWVFYGKVHFNKTTTDRLYNLQYEKECPYDQRFDVMGCVDFEHDGVSYSLKRTHTFKKGYKETTKVAEDFVLLYRDDDFNWRRMDGPKEAIEKLLPSGLSDYFFFDGESMIADLRLKGKDSAGKLRQALYSIFDLDIIESAISHIGSTDLRTTVLGKLYLNKGTITSGSHIATVKGNIENVQKLIEEYNEKLSASKNEKAECNSIILEVSEKIGGYKSKTEYENERKKLKTNRDLFLKNVKERQEYFGDEVFELFPRLLISKAVVDSKVKFHFKNEENGMPTVFSKKLIDYLLSTDTLECVCGNKLCENEKKHIAQYLNRFTSKNVTNLYQDFLCSANDWGKGYNKAKIEEYIVSAIENNDSAVLCDDEIRKLDNDEKKNPNIEELVIARQDAEQRVIDLDEIIIELEKELKKYELYKNKQMKDYDALTSGNEKAEKEMEKIGIMEEVLSAFKTNLAEKSIGLSQALQTNIQQLIDEMLTTKRYVNVSPEFSVRVTDSFDDESKSEGQFAVVSFAYIGGILRMLQKGEYLQTKEYPLVLDGPFSKLDSDQRQNVINIIPEFAPQVIIFSKDDLHEYFNNGKIGRSWTIVSNEEKNIAIVKEGHLWK